MQQSLNEYNWMNRIGKIALIKMAFKGSLVFVLFITAFWVNAQDKIITVEGEELKCLIDRVGDKEVVYIDRTNQRKRISKEDIDQIYFGKAIKELHDYAEDRIKAIKWNPYALKNNALILSYEKALSPKESVEFTAKVFGVSLNKFEDFKRGGALDFGYRFRVANLLSRDNRSQTTHSFDGLGVKAIGGIAWARERVLERESTYYYAQFGLQLDYRLVFSNRWMLELYGGLHLFKGNNKVKLPNTPELEGSFNVADGDLILENDAAGYSYGVKVGYLFGSYDTDEKITRW